MGKNFSNHSTPLNCVINPGSGVGGLRGGGVGVLARAVSLGGGPSLVFGGSITGSGVFSLGGDGGLAISFVTGFVGLTCFGVVGGRDSASDGCLLESSVASRSKAAASSS